MSDEIEIRRNIELVYIIQLAETVETEDGNMYFKFPDWFQWKGDAGFILHREMPEDLREFITKAGLGGDNPQPKKPKIGGTK